VLMVSVRMSAGTPLAIRMLQRVSSNPQAFIVFCDDCVTWAGFPGVTNVRTTCNTEQNSMVLFILWNKHKASNDNHEYLKLWGWLLQEMLTQFSQEHLKENSHWEDHRDKRTSLCPMIDRKFEKRP
jgi:hypothetical protein